MPMVCAILCTPLNRPNGARAHCIKQMTIKRIVMDPGYGIIVWKCRHSGSVNFLTLLQSFTNFFFLFVFPFFAGFRF